MTPQEVKERLREAGDTCRRLACQELRWVRSRAGTWPNIVRLASEAYGYDGDPLNLYRNDAERPTRPSPAAIDRMDEAVGWLFWVDRPTRRILWGRAIGTTWKQLRRTDGRSEPTMRNVHRQGCEIISKRLTEQKKIQAEKCMNINILVPFLGCPPHDGRKKHFRFSRKIGYMGSERGRTRSKQRSAADDTRDGAFFVFGTSIT